MALEKIIISKKELEDVLNAAVDKIKQWHLMRTGLPSSGDLPNDIWITYLNKSPDMKPIRNFAKDYDLFIRELQQ